MGNVRCAVGEGYVARRHDEKTAEEPLHVVEPGLLSLARQVIEVEKARQGDNGCQHPGHGKGFYEIGIEGHGGEPLVEDGYGQDGDHRARKEGHEEPGTMGRTAGVMYRPDYEPEQKV